MCSPNIARLDKEHHQGSPNLLEIHLPRVKLKTGHKITAIPDSLTTKPVDPSVTTQHKLILNFSTGKLLMDFSLPKQLFNFSHVTENGIWGTLIMHTIVF